MRPLCLSATKNCLNSTFFVFLFTLQFSPYSFFVIFFDKRDPGTMHRCILCWGLFFYAFSNLLLNQFFMRPTLFCFIFSVTYPCASSIKLAVARPSFPLYLLRTLKLPIQRINGQRGAMRFARTKHRFIVSPRKALLKIYYRERKSRCWRLECFRW